MEMETKEIELAGKKFRLHKIPCIPGVEIMAKCAPIVDMTRWDEVTMEQVLRLALYADVEVAGEMKKLENAQMILAFLSSEQLWLLAQSVYVFSFGFFITGGIQSMMGPVIQARKEAQELLKAKDSPSNTEM